VLLGHGGFTTLGVNTVVSATGALVSHCVFRALSGSNILRLPPAPAAFAASLAGFAASAALYLAAMGSGGESLLAVARTCLAFYAPVAAVEALATGFVISFLVRVRPEVLAPRCERARA
jgi:cobalt/nickel transport system permease protein